MFTNLATEASGLLFATISAGALLPRGIFRYTVTTDSGKIDAQNLPGDYLVYTLSLAEDAEGELLLLTPAGLCRITNGRLGSPEALPLPSNGRELLKVRSLMVDREGNLWVGTNGTGLVRLRRAPLIAYGKDEGLSDQGLMLCFRIVKAASGWAEIPLLVRWAPLP